jgi:GT2 family glycosyltransferase
VAILNYDGRELLAAMLPTVFAMRDATFDVVVVDNGSSDGSQEWLAAEWPAVRVVRIESNAGVTPALNAMVRAASRYEFVALLNNDLELEPEWLALLIATLDEHPRAAAAAGKLLRQQAPDTIDRAGDVVHWSGACFGRGAGERDTGQYDSAEEVFAVGGAAALYRMRAFAEVGGYDEDFFAYLEDVDWGVRARLAGFTARYEPRAVGFHRGGATLGDINTFSLYHLRRNTIWLVAKNWPALALARHGWRVMLFLAAGLAFAMRPKQVGTVLKAYRDGLLGLRRALGKRRGIQRRATGDLAAAMPERARIW